MLKLLFLVLELARASVTVEPDAITLRWDTDEWGNGPLEAVLGPPTTGACWHRCSWGPNVTFTVHKTRTVNYTTLAITRP